MASGRNARLNCASRRIGIHFDADRRALEIDPELTISRLKEIYPVARYKNLDGFLDGLGKAGVLE